MATPTAKKSALVPNATYAVPATQAQLERAAVHLKEHGIQAIVVPDRAEALRTVLSLIPEHSEVLVSTSETLAQIGLSKEVEESGKYVSIRKRLYALDRKTQEREWRELSQSPQYDVGSVHAVTEDGDLLIASATGSQFGPYAFGSGKVVWVVGAQKVVPTLQDGLKRLREYSLPMEDARALRAYGMNSGLNKILVISREVLPGRATVVLVKEVLGF
ncbi:MAG: lactate utilization protein [Thermoplasmata archaeon]|nr:lactate utilization protein [Thermoplasmata archaeon]